MKTFDASLALIIAGVFGAIILGALIDGGTFDKPRSAYISPGEVDQQLANEQVRTLPVKLTK